MTIELVLQHRDKDGNPTQRRSIITNDGEGNKLADFWYNNRHHSKNKRRKDKGALTDSQAEKILKEIFGDKENQKTKNKVEVKGN